MSDMHTGYLLMSDISGYTTYLTESELDHAKETLSALLEVLIQHTRPPLAISRLEGDAVISYGLQDDIGTGQVLLKGIQNTYVAFRKAIERMVLNNTCKCKACANLSTLDLKFFLHYGEFAIQRLGEYNELVGSEVNLLHRLVKNRVREQLGLAGYLLCTEPALERLGAPGSSGEMKAHTELDEVLGEISVWVQDMRPVWKREREKSKVRLTPEQITGELSVEIKAPPDLVWDYLSRPRFRAYLHGSDRQELTVSAEGQIGPGAVYQCYHGETRVAHVILEWEPNERIVTRETAPIPINGTYYYTEYGLQQTKTGTNLSLKVTKARGPFLGRLLLRLMSPMFDMIMTGNIERFAREIERDLHGAKDAQQRTGETGGGENRPSSAAPPDSSKDAEKERPSD